MKNLKRIFFNVSNLRLAYIFTKLDWLKIQAEEIRNKVSELTNAIENSNNAILINLDR